MHICPQELSKVDDKVHLASTQSSGLLEDLRRHMKDLNCHGALNMRSYGLSPSHVNCKLCLLVNLQELEEAAAKDEANVAAEFSAPCTHMEYICIQH